MGMLGNKPAAGFQSIEKQTITGNGSTTYALDHAVTNVNDLEVFVNNVRQEPTTAYTLSGQNIVMSEAIANTDSFYVIYQSRSFTKAVPADTSVTAAMLQDDYVNVTGDGMTGNLGVGGAANGSYAITSHSSGGQNLRFENDNEYAFFRLQDNGDLQIWAHGDDNIVLMNGTGSGTTRMNIDGSGRVTMTNQPGCSYLGSKSYVIGTTGTQVMSSSNVWASSVNHGHNRGSHFNAATGRFTCPVAGRYQFHFKCQASNFGSGYLWFYMRLNQSTFSYSQKSQENAWTCQYLGGILELNANDYVDVAWTNNYVSGQIHMPEFTAQLIS